MGFEAKAVESRLGRCSIHEAKDSLMQSVPASLNEVLVLVTGERGPVKT